MEIVPCIRSSSPFLVSETSLSGCALQFLNSKSMSWQNDLRVVSFWTKVWILSSSVITLKTYAIRDFSTENKQFVQQSQMVTCFRNSKLRQTNWFVGLHAKEFKIQCAWKCYVMYAEAILFWFARLVIVCTLISQQQENFITCEKKLLQNKWFAWMKKLIFHWFLPSVSL